MAVSDRLNAWVLLDADGPERTFFTGAKSSDRPYIVGPMTVSVDYGEKLGDVGGSTLRFSVLDPRKKAARKFARAGLHCVMWLASSDADQERTLFYGRIEESTITQHKNGNVIVDILALSGGDDLEKMKVYSYPGDSNLKAHYLAPVYTEGYFKAVDRGWDPSQMIEIYDKTGKIDHYLYTPPQGMHDNLTGAIRTLTFYDNGTRHPNGDPIYLSKSNGRNRHAPMLAGWESNKFNKPGGFPVPNTATTNIKMNDVGNIAEAVSLGAAVAGGRVFCSTSANNVDAGGSDAWGTLASLIFAQYRGYDGKAIEIPAGYAVSSRTLTSKRRHWSNHVEITTTLAWTGYPEKAQPSQVTLTDDTSVSRDGLNVESYDLALYDGAKNLCKAIFKRPKPAWVVSSVDILTDQLFEKIGATAASKMLYTIFTPYKLENRENSHGPNYVPSMDIHGVLDVTGVGSTIWGVIEKAEFTINPLDQPGPRTSLTVTLGGGDIANLYDPSTYDILGAWEHAPEPRFSAIDTAYTFTTWRGPDFA
ncbi:hypothetical protein QP572_02345 [Brevibacterium sp. UMB10442]|nr:hypothetical protein [Brevibacterium sp. UMB10442]